MLFMRAALSVLRKEEQGRVHGRPDKFIMPFSAWRTDNRRWWSITGGRERCHLFATV